MISAASAEKKRFLLKIIKAAVFVNATQFLILTIQIPAYLLEKFVLQNKYSTRVHAKRVVLENFLQKIVEAALFAKVKKTCMYMPVYVRSALMAQYQERTKWAASIATMTQKLLPMVAVYIVNLEQFLILKQPGV